MNALILVGGYGTRLRPLTLTTPKPLISFCNKPILEHQIYNLSKCGIKEIILAIAYKPTDIKNFVNELEEKYDVRIFFSVEEECLGTGGPIKLAKNYLMKYEDFFVFNSDIICSFPLEEMMKFHKEQQSQLTILVKEVEDPSAFGVVITEGNKIIKFEEKPLVPKSSMINAGIYILNRKNLDLIPLKNTSLEKEIFPKLAEEGKLYFFNLNDFWADIGKPLDFLRGQKLYLIDLCERKKKGENTLHDYLCIDFDFEYKQNNIQNGTNNNTNTNNLFISFESVDELNHFVKHRKNTFGQFLCNAIIEGNVIVSSKAIIKNNCVLGDNVVIGHYVTVEEGCRIKNSCIMNNSKINEYSYIENSIIGSKSLVGKWSRIEGLSVLGENVNLKSELFLNNVFILPFKEVNKSVYEKGSIIM